MTYGYILKDLNLSWLTKILFVDDEHDILKAISRGLTSKGIDVDTYDNPIDALKNFRPKTYDLILLDVKLPQMSGFELYEKIKEIDFEAKIYFLSAFEFLEVPNNIVPNLGGTNFLRKPITIKQLVELISSNISNNAR